MSQAHTYSMALSGLEPVELGVIAESVPGTGRLVIHGLRSEAAAREARVRVLSALAQGQWDHDGRDVTVTVTPGGIGGGTCDVAIAVAVLRALAVLPVGHHPEKNVEDMVFLGELSLDGYVRPTRGVSVFVSPGHRRFVVPSGNRAEAGVSSGGAIIAHRFSELVDYIQGAGDIEMGDVTEIHPTVSGHEVVDLSDIRGNVVAKRALEIAAAGKHSVLFIGPPGSGKTLLARSLPALMPTPMVEELLEITRIQSIAGFVHDRGYADRRPFRAPHHTVSDAGLIGGGSPLRPGEVTLAHHGVLFLDEVEEFRGAALDGLRGVRKHGAVSLHRVDAVTEFPADALLVGAAMPCPCGRRNYDDLCRCSDAQVRRHRDRLAGLADLFDIAVRVQTPTVAELTSAPMTVETSATVRTRILNAQSFALSAQSRPIGVGAVSVATRALRDPVTLRLARTIANMQYRFDIDEAHFAEAVELRRFQ